MDITDAKRKRALLLYQVGQQTHNIFDTLPDHGAEDDYKTAVDTLSAYFLPKRNVAYEIFQFRQAKQLPGESVHQYSTRLRHLAATCEFADVDSEIKAAIIQNCTSKRLRRYALREETLTLANLLATARAFEVSDHQAKGMEDSLVLPNSIAPKQERAHLVRSGRNGPSFQRTLRSTTSYSSPAQYVAIVASIYPIKDIAQLVDNLVVPVGKLTTLRKCAVLRKMSRHTSQDGKCT